MRLKKVLGFLGATSTLAALGAIYMYVATRWGGMWLGSFSFETLLPFQVGLSGVAAAALSTLVLAGPISLAAVFGRVGWLGVGLGSVRPVGGNDGAVSAENNQQSWSALLFGAPSAIVILAVALTDWTFYACLFAGSCLGTAVALLALKRLRTTGFPIDAASGAFLVLLTVIAPLSAAALYFGPLSVEIGYLTLVRDAFGTLATTSLAVLAASLVAWLYLPADRATVRNRLAVVFLGFVLLSLTPYHSIRVIDLAMEWTTEGNGWGRFVSRTSGNTISLPSCLSEPCDAPSRAYLVGRVEDEFIYKFHRPVGDGTFTLQDAAISVESARFEPDSQRPMHIDRLSLL